MVDVTSFALGALAGITASVVTARGILRTAKETPQRATQDVYECRGCGARRYGEQDAKEHARDAHNAPLQDDAWRWLYTDGGG